MKKIQGLRTLVYISTHFLPHWWEKILCPLKPISQLTLALLQKYHNENKYFSTILIKVHSQFHWLSSNFHFSTFQQAVTLVIVSNPSCWLAIIKTGNCSKICLKAGECTYGETLENEHCTLVYFTHFIYFIILTLIYFTKLYVHLL